MSRKQPLKVAPAIRHAGLLVTRHRHLFGLASFRTYAQTALRSVAIVGAGLILAAVASATDGIESPATTAATPGPLELRAIDYIRFRDDVTSIEALKFDNAGITRDAHKRLASHETRQITAGWMAYAALIAADTPAFSDAIKAEVLGTANGEQPKKSKKRKRGEPEELVGRDAFIAKISADPRYPRSLPGANAAIAEIIRMTNKDYFRVTSLGESFKAQAYSMQKTRWGKDKIAQSASQRISEAEYYGRTRPGIAMPQFATVTLDGVSTPGIMATTEYSWKPDWGYMTSDTNSAASDSDAVLDRILNLAARYAVGALNDKVVDVYASNNKSEQCLSLVKLTLNQCIASTRTPYEEAFCLGEHGLNDVAGCIGWIGGHGG